MDLSKLADPFPAEDVEWRVQQCGLTKEGKPWAKVLAYIQARAVMDRLDAVVGPENWKVSYQHHTDFGPPLKNGGVMCLLFIRCRTGELPSEGWVCKSDGAQATEFEPFKGGISGALKRAAVCWGVGRYLYHLEEGWADCSKDTREYPHYGKTKDGTAFSWKPPALPAWALPGGSGRPDAEKPAKSRKAPQKARKGRSEPRPVSDAQLQKIGILRRELEIPDDAYRKGLIEYYDTASTRDLTTEQAGDLIERLEARERAKRKDEADEAFGGEGRLGKLRAQALGFCDTIGRHGTKYASGEPLDFSAFGLKDGTLTELRKLIECIEDEKELEGVITRLEEVLEAMSF